MDRATLQEIKAKTRLSDLIRPTIRLKRASGGYMGSCCFHKDSTPSFHVSDTKGTFKCFSCGAWGDCFDWLILSKGMSLVQAAEYLAGGRLVSNLSFKDPAVQPRSVHDEDEVRRIKLAHAIWLRRSPIEGTIAEDYLRETRGIRGPIPLALGFSNNVFCSLLGEESPCLIAPLQTSDGIVTAIQQIFLCKETQDAWRDASGKRFKRSLGAMRDGAVRLGMPDKVLGLAGSVEDALSASWLYSLPVWATCGEHRMARVWAPPEIEQIVVFADADDPGMKAAQDVKEAHRGKRRVTIMLPGATKDFTGMVEARA